MGYTDDRFVQALDEYVAAKVEVAVTEAVDNNSTLVTGDDFSDHLSDTIGYMADPTDWFDMSDYITDDDVFDRIDDRYVKCDDFDDLAAESIARYLGQDFTLSDLVTLTKRVEAIEAVLSRVHLITEPMAYDNVAKRRNGEGV